MKQLSKETVNWLDVGAEESGQRIDNYLIRWLKGVPKSHIYRILRSGEVRVNKGRIGPDYRVQDGDRVRVPPIRTAQRDAPAVLTSGPRVAFDILYEDAALLVINKPSGLAVHGGSGVSFGAIEQLRAARPQAKFLELVHRLDRDTSGVLMFAKKRSALVALHEQLREGHVRKIYLALVRGHWRDAKRAVKAPLQKHLLANGERRVAVNEKDGQAAHTIFRLRHAWPKSTPPFSLLEAELKTGRTHQIRVHLAHLEFPIAGDDKYGDFPLNKILKKQILKRMFLHASQVGIAHPDGGEPLRFDAPLPEELEAVITYLNGHLNKDHAETI
ncbi:MAG: 23S rRNA pseudouridine(955/2504/2580) synthase RluC [Burkholderiales bacterium]